MRTSVAVLDDALDRVSGLDFEVPNRFVNHAPMACEALDALGLDSLIGEWVRGFESFLGQAVQPVPSGWPRGFDWKDRLGDYRLLPEWMGYFERAIAGDGWPTVVRTWVPRLMPGLVAALFHGVIRTSHAVRAIDHVDTPARRAELARALGNWAAWFSPGQPVEEARGADDPGSAALAAAAAGARCYVTAPTIFNLHGVTGAMAVHLLSDHLSTPEAAAAARQLQAEHRSLYRGVPPMAEAGLTEHWDDDVMVAASQSHDSHQIKLTEACHRGFVMTGDLGFAAAAQTVTAPQADP
jgi:Questin oxidase-like